MRECEPDREPSYVDHTLATRPPGILSKKNGEGQKRKVWGELPSRSSVPEGGVPISTLGMKLIRGLGRYTGGSRGRSWLRFLSLRTRVRA